MNSHFGWEFAEFVENWVSFDRPNSNETHRNASNNSMNCECAWNAKPHTTNYKLGNPFDHWYCHRENLCEPTKGKTGESHRDEFMKDFKQIHTEFTENPTKAQTCEHQHIEISSL